MRALIGIFTSCVLSTPLRAQASPVVGPANGTVIVVGGGQIEPDILNRFIG
jgi:hypothetical protein